MSINGPVWGKIEKCGDCHECQVYNRSETYEGEYSCARSYPLSGGRAKRVNPNCQPPEWCIFRTYHGGKGRGDYQAWQDKLNAESIAKFLS